MNGDPLHRVLGQHGKQRASAPRRSSVFAVEKQRKEKR